MLPIFRLIPVGGVLLAIAILLLALDPPPATNPSARVALALAPARGPLIDRDEHPEWRQFLILAALRRADEVERLRDLRDTVIRPQPLTQMPEAMTVAPQAAAPSEATPEAVRVKPVAAEPKLAAADEPKVAEATPTAVEQKTAETAPIVAKPERALGAATQLASITPATLPDARPIAAAAPAPGKAAGADAVAATASMPETNGSRISSGPAPTEPAKPPAADTKVAALPAASVPLDDSDVTGSIAPEQHTATIPVGIGEASSVELLVTLPRRRPPVLRRLDIRRARGGRIERPERRAHHLARAKTKKPGVNELPPEFNLLALLFQAFIPDGNFQQIKPNSPHQPGTKAAAQP